MNLKINKNSSIWYIILPILLLSIILLMIAASKPVFAASSQIRITEIMYDPSGNGDREFLEIYNGSDTTVNLGGMALFGVDYTFPGGTTLGPGQYGVIVRNLSVFKSNNPGARVFGQYGGKLRGGGELISISKNGVVQTQVSYSYGGAWPSSPKDGGPSLSLVRTNANETQAACWAASAISGGTPSSANNPSSAGSGCSTIAYPKISQPSVSNREDTTLESSESSTDESSTSQDGDKTEEELLQEQAEEEAKIAEEASQQIANESAANRDQTRTNIIVALAMIGASLFGALLFNVYRAVKVKISHAKLMKDSKHHAKHEQKG
ncbi:lamin tail domain-containing protein [Candidatus Saccharibacteria bacterium]|nr:lamin tail domain-containing protein [Candidatus Saccharibacteria bacterium]